MEEPQQAAYGTFQCTGVGLTADLLKEINRHMDTADRRSWRLVNKAACQAVYDSTTALAPCSDVTVSTAALLPQLLGKCSGLQQLSCRGLRRLHSISGLLHLPLRLQALDISHTDVTDLSFIARCPSLRRLAAAKVPGCAGPESRQLAAVLQQLHGLTALDLQGNTLLGAAARDVAAVLQNLTGLEELDIGDVGQDAAPLLLRALPYLERQRRLSLSRCHADGPALLPTLLQLTQLQRLNLSQNKLTAADALILAPAVRELRQLEAMDLSGTYMGDAGVAALAPAIQQLTGLTVLSLAYNDFGLAGAQALAPALQHLTRLRDLCLDWNRFGPDGAWLLAPAIQQLTGLLRLHLSSVALGGEGVAALAPALRRLVALQDLDLSQNAMRPGGLQALLPAIQQLVNLRGLHLRYNNLDGAALRLLRASASCHGWRSWIWWAT